MSEAAQNTKVERVAEAIESLVLAAVAGLATNALGKMLDTKSPHERFDDVALAREELAHSLKEFLRPVLRVVVENKAVDVEDINPADGYDISRL